MLQLLKPVCPEPVLCNKRSQCNEELVHLNGEWPLLFTTRESPRVVMKTHCNEEEKMKERNLATVLERKRVWNSMKGEAQPPACPYQGDRRVSDMSWTFQPN